jgi:antitoxin YefM
VAGVLLKARTETLYHGKKTMETTYTKLRAELASVLDRVAENQEVVIVRRRGAKDVAMIPADELSSLMETAHLLRSPKNAQRLLRALKRAQRGRGRASSLEQLRGEMGFGRKA